MRSGNPEVLLSRPGAVSGQDSIASETSYVEKALGLGLLLVLLAGCIIVLYPFVSAILLAIPLRQGRHGFYSGS